MSLQITLEIGTRNLEKDIKSFMDKKKSCPNLNTGQKLKQQHFFLGNFSAVFRRNYIS